MIDDADLVLFFEGLQAGLIGLERGGRFNTLDRPVPGGRWSLLSRSRQGGWYNAEYLPQLADYVELIRHLGYPADRVLFELPPRSLQLDLAVLTDQGTVTILGEAKRAVGMLDPLLHAVHQRFSQAHPGEETRHRGDEARQLAWRLWADQANLLVARRPWGAPCLPLHLRPAAPAAPAPVPAVGWRAWTGTPPSNPTVASDAALMSASIPSRPRRRRKRATATVSGPHRVADAYPSPRRRGSPQPRPN